MLVSVNRLVLSIGTIISFNITVTGSSMCFPQINASSCAFFLSLPSEYRRFLTDKTLIESFDVSRSFGRFSLNLAVLLKFVEKL